MYTHTCSHIYMHTNKSWQRPKYAHFPLLTMSRNISRLFYQHRKRGKVLICFPLSDVLLRVFLVAAHLPRHAHSNTHTQTHNQALFALEGVSLTLWEIKWHALLAGVVFSSEELQILLKKKRGIIFTWVSSSEEGWLNKQRNEAPLLVLQTWWEGKILISVRPLHEGNQHANWECLHIWILFSETKRIHYIFKSSIWLLTVLDNRN